MNLKLIMIVVLTFTTWLSLAQSTEIRYTYDENGNRDRRYTVFLRVAQGSGSTTTNAGFEESAKLQEESGLVDKAQGDLSLTLFPNPVQDEVRLEWSVEDIQTDEVRVLTDQGKEVYRQGPQTGNFSVPFGTMSPGHYIIWLKTVEGIRRYAIIKR